MEADLLPGYYRTRREPRGPWVPVRVWIEDGDRDPETGDLLSDQIYHAEWFLGRWYPINPFEIIGVNRRWWFFREVTKDEFEWLKILNAL